MFLRELRALVIGFLSLPLACDIMSTLRYLRGGVLYKPFDTSFALRETLDSNICIWGTIWA